MTVDLHLGDCRDVMAAMPEASFGSIVCDPPYELGFMGRRWDRTGVAFDVRTWTEALRVAKPGAHLVAFGGTRTFHRLTCAVEDAGWEIRDCLSWMYGQGFPKSHNGEWGGTALKPGWEPIVLARKPLDGTVAKTFAAHGTGGLNIEACRLEGTPRTPGVADPTRVTTRDSSTYGTGLNATAGARQAAYTANPPSGRWPTNVVLSHAAGCELIGHAVVAANGSIAGGEPSAVAKNVLGDRGRVGFAAHGNGDGTETVERWRCAAECPVRSLNEQAGDVGSHGGLIRGGHLGFKGGSLGASREVPASTGLAARFFYCAKATPAERGAGNTWPTVKPLELMRWLCRLVTPKGGRVLDPFHGSGSTLLAAQDEGFDVVGIDESEEARAIAQRRLDDAAGPLFAGRTGT